jgi:hypothetical protein
MTPVVKTAKNLVMAVALLLASAAATADDPAVSTQVVDWANKLSGVHPPNVADTGVHAHPSLPHREQAQSWDQENLKRNDRGCPTAMFYVNPKTQLLQQCE